jgi:hypothetical protein
VTAETAVIAVIVIIFLTYSFGFEPIILQTPDVRRLIISAILCSFEDLKAR